LSGASEEGVAIFGEDPPGLDEVVDCAGVSAQIFVFSGLALGD
jgi:hypothetical protein